VSLVTAMATVDTTCVWLDNERSLPDLEVLVACRDKAGSYVDRKFAVSFVTHIEPRGAFAYALGNQRSATTYGAIDGNSYDNAGGPVAIKRKAAGSYLVTIPHLSIATGGNLEVSGGPFNPPYTRFAACRAASYPSPSAVKVRCENAAGTLVN